MMDREALEDLARELEESERPPGRAFELVSDRHARDVLWYLAAESESTLEALTDVVAGREAYRAGDVVTPTQRDRIRTRLYHVVLPKLSVAGWVRFDAEEWTVTETGVPPAVEALLAAFDDERGG